jgi:hypothetical protein
MTPGTPPRLATLLLSLFAVDEALAGDLEEEFRAGRSRAWYWRQVIAAVSVGSRRGIDVHDLFAVQRMPMQVIMLGLVSVCAVFTVKLIGTYVVEHDVAAFLVSAGGLREILRLSVSFAAAIPLGIAIARIHAASRRTAVLAFSIVIPLWSAANLFLLNGAGNLDAALPHVLASLVFIAGLLSGGIHVDPLIQSRRGA